MPERAEQDGSSGLPCCPRQTKTLSLKNSDGAYDRGAESLHKGPMQTLNVSWAGVLAVLAMACASTDASDSGTTTDSSSTTTPGPIPSSSTPGETVSQPTVTSSGSSPPATAPSTSASPTTSLPTSAPTSPSSTTSTGETSAPASSDEPQSSTVSESSNDVVTSSDGAETVPLDDPSRPLTIWLAGDSTMANGNTPCPTGWGKHLGALFNEHTTVRNSAAGGRSVRTWMYNVTAEMGGDGECVLQRDGQGNPTLQPRWQEMLDNMKAGDALLIQFGINDGSPTCDRHVGLAAFKQTFGVLAAAAEERGVQPVFITPVSSIACNGNVPRGTRGEFVDATLEVGAELDVPVLDLHARSVERYAELGFCPVPGGAVNASTGGAVGEYFCDDHTHFSSSGATDMAAVVVELMKKANLPFVSHLKAQP